MTPHIPQAFADLLIPFAVTVVLLAVVGLQIYFDRGPQR